MITIVVLIFLIICLGFLVFNIFREPKIPFKLLDILFKDETAYDRLLKTNEWYNFRLSILNIHNHTCDWCGSKLCLLIHHKKYLKLPNGKMINPWEYNPKDLMCLCSTCHKKYHEKYKVNVYYISYDNFNKQIKNNETNLKKSC